MQDKSKTYETGSELEDGVRIGKDPRKMSQEDLKSIGHMQKPILSVIREKCLDCCCGQTQEVRRCMSVTCPLWPYRMGTNPVRDKVEMAPERRLEAAERLMAMRGNRLKKLEK